MKTGKQKLSRERKVWREMNTGQLKTLACPNCIFTTRDDSVYRAHWKDKHGPNTAADKQR